MKSSRLIKNVVADNREIAKGVYVLSVEKNYDFIPGQIVALSVEPDDREPRLYSICSGIHENVISILYNIVPDGKLTGRLSSLKKGDLLYSSMPYGRFTIGSESSFWIATGTGIAPFISKIRSCKIKNTTLLHGGRDEASFYFSKEFTEVMGAEYIRCSSTLKKTGFFEGRVSAYLKEIADLPVSRKYYLCGRAEMVVESRDILISRGIPYNMIESEIYF